MFLNTAADRMLSAFSNVREGSSVPEVSAPRVSSACWILSTHARIASPAGVDCR